MRRVLEEIERRQEEEFTRREQEKGIFNIVCMANFVCQNSLRNYLKEEMENFFVIYFFVIYFFFCNIFV